jgi:integrase
MPRRKGRRSFGSLRQLPSGPWQARYRDAAGKSHMAPQTFATRPEAARFLAQVETDLARGEWTDPRAGRVSFAEWAARWQQTTTNLRPNTRALHGYLLRRFLLPAFAETALADLDLMAVRSWLAGLEREAVSPNTVAKAYRLLARILDTAVEAGLIVRNPCSVKGAATERAPGMRVATVTQVAALAQAIHPRFRALVLVASYAGLRWGELVGLRVKRVDLLHQRITVAEQATEIDGHFTWGPPKTEAGRRTVTLPAVAAAALAEHLATYSQHGPEGLVFTSTEGGLLRRSNFNRRVWQPATRAAGLEGLRFHDLRHTSATLSIAAGGQHPGADGPDGALLLGRCPALSARDGRPLHPGAASPGRQPHCPGQRRRASRANPRPRGERAAASVALAKLFNAWPWRGSALVSWSTGMAGSAGSRRR